MTNHGYSFNFNVLKYFGSFSFHDICQLSSVSWSHGETNIQTLQNLQCETPKKGLKEFVFPNFFDEPYHAH
jgi:hypothetical protein